VSTANTLRVIARILRPDGAVVTIDFQATVSTDRTASQTDYRIAKIHEGELVSACIFNQSGTMPKRGQVYVSLELQSQDNIAQVYLCSGYVADREFPTYPFLVPPGPGGGEGNLFFETIASDVAGNVSTPFTPAVTNAFRKVYGVVWYYNASADVASRVLSILVRRPWGALPTGFGTASKSDVYSRALVTLTASEEGTVFMVSDGRDGYTSVNDNDTVTWENTTTVPSPFPFLVREDDPVTVIFVPAVGNANDRYSAYALVEEWLVT